MATVDPEMREKPDLPARIVREGRSEVGVSPGPKRPATAKAVPGNLPNNYHTIMMMNKTRLQELISKWWLPVLIAATLTVFSYYRVHSQPQLLKGLHDVLHK
jgi:hypothetical protein